ncbi:unnamed protein product, partial [Rotaria magnacalcarata]
VAPIPIPTNSKSRIGIELVGIGIGISASLANIFFESTAFDLASSNRSDQIEALLCIHAFFQPFSWREKKIENRSQFKIQNRTEPRRMNPSLESDEFRSVPIGIRLSSSEGARKLSDYRRIPGSGIDIGF